MKEKNISKNKKLLIIGIIVSVLVLTLGITYAVLVDYGRLSNVNSELVLGDIYMHYNDSSQGINLENAIPSDTYDPNNYFEFTIDGKNTSNKDIWYEIDLVHGNNHETRTTRIRDDLLKFTLVEIKDSVETVVVDSNSYKNLTSKRIWINTIPKNTTSDISYTYRLYMWIDSNTVIGNVGQDYTIDEWNDVYASIKVKIKGDFYNKNIYNSTDFKNMLLKDKTNYIVQEDNIVYISGAQTNIDFNYVWYSGKLWRITAVYPDGTMKMITDDVIANISYGSDVNFYTDNENKSYVYQWLNEDFLDTLYNYENIIVTDSKWNATAISSLEIKTKLPETTIVTAPVGLLNTYESYLSYKNTSDSSGYLNIGYFWWLLNPYNNFSGEIACVSYKGYINGVGYYSIPSSSSGVRPSINLKSRIQLSGGSGTKTDPYTIAGDKEEVTAGTTLLNTRSSGEYVKFNNELYRIVSIENDITKINKNDYVRDTSNNVLRKKFSTSVIYGGGSTYNDYWDYYLNNTWYNALDSTYQNMIVESIYYIPTVSDGTSYKKAICATVSNTVTTKDCEKTGDTWTGLVGLPRYGEMFASQQGSGYSSSSNMWLMNSGSASYVWIVNSKGYSRGNESNDSNNSPTDTNGGRPSINLKSNIKITGGNGTKDNPFEISE